MAMKCMTIREFFAIYPTDETCLEHLFGVRFGQGFECPKCKRAAKWYRIKAERAYSCQWCGHHLHPTVDTPFESTRTPLQHWFFAIYLFTTTRNGVSAKELQRQLGVTYKTAWRMGHEIRKHMADVDGENPLKGDVEVDETYVGGKRRKSEGSGRGAGGKTILVGMLERNGEIMTKVVPNASRWMLQGLIKENVEQGSTVHTDEWPSYKGLENKGYTHKRVRHSKGEYVNGDSHVNGLEGFWAHLKNGLRSTHVHVSGKHLEKYAKEFEYRFNSRETPSEMFPELISTFPKQEKK